jgi:UDP-N-acetyl-2-amino-2-deoxyglucuronate dehydrogenase
MKFALAGVGYIAEKHLQAIKSVDGELIAVCDVNDSVGILDKYFINTEFFTDHNEFEKYLSNNLPDYLVICTPNYSHINYLQMADRLDIQSICEKPLVIHPTGLNLFKDTNAIVQLRYANSLEKIQPMYNGEIEIKYSTPRGSWYHKSWKGDDNLSGGLLTNIGIHLFDLMIYLFGKPSKPILEYQTYNEIKGNFLAGNTLIKWHLSVNPIYEPLRKINDIVLNMEGLHIKAYQEIIKGNGVKKENVKQSLELINEYRTISKSIPVL